MFPPPTGHPDTEESELSSLTSDELEGEIVGLAAEVSALTCRWLGLVAEVERRGLYGDWGSRTCAEWLAWRCSLSTRAAREHVRVARSLRDLPRVRAAFARGELSYSKVRAITRVATAADEAELLEAAEHATTDQLERIVRVYRGALSLSEAREAERERFVAWSWERDGSLSFRGRLTGEEAPLLLRALERARDDAFEAAEPGSAGRAKQISNADAMVAMAEMTLASGPKARTGGERYQVVVHADAELLAGEASSGRCVTADGSPLAAETARRLACDASVVPIFERDGKPIGIGRRSRSIPPSIRRLLDARDGGCRFPGCNNRRFVENHHLEHWARGGDTNEENLIQLCRRHHDLIHEGGYSVARSGDRFVFRRPDGRVIDEVPCMRRRPLAERPRRPRGETHRPTRGGPAREPLDLDHVTFALLTQPGAQERIRGPDRS